MTRLLVNESSRSLMKPSNYIVMECTGGPSSQRVEQDHVTECCLPFVGWLDNRWQSRLDPGNAAPPPAAHRSHWRQQPQSRQAGCQSSGPACPGEQTLETPAHGTLNLGFACQSWSVRTGPPMVRQSRLESACTQDEAADVAGWNLMQMGSTGRGLAGFSRAEQDVTCRCGINDGPRPVGVHKVYLNVSMTPCSRFSFTSRCGSLCNEQGCDRRDILWQRGIQVKSAHPLTHTLASSTRADQLLPQQGPSCVHNLRNGTLLSPCDGHLSCATLAVNSGMTK